MEMSFESIMAVGTGMVSRENVEEQDNTTVNYDGYADGTEADLARTEEALHFADTYFKLQDMHSSEKLRMIKKINTAYNGKTIGNTNVANSVESFCNNAMSTEGVREVAAKVKAKFIEIFKKIAEFFKNLIIKVVAAKYRGKTAEMIKQLLKYDHDQMNALITVINSTSDEKITPEYKEELAICQKYIEVDRKFLLELLKFFSLAAKLARKTGTNKKAGIDDVVNTDEIEQMKLGTDLNGNQINIGKSLANMKNAANLLNSFKRKDIIKQMIDDLKSGAKNIAAIKQLWESTRKVVDETYANIQKANEEISAKLKEAKDKKGAEAPASAAAEEPKA